MAEVILIVAFIVLLCVLLNKLSGKIGVPMLLAFILLGMVFGADGLFKIEFSNYAFSEKICSTALIFIMFYGGFGTKWSTAKPVAISAALLSTLGVILTAALTGLFCFFVLRIGFLESLLIGAVISSTDAASVFSILRSKKLGLKYNTASLLEVESGSNDPCSYMLTIVILSIMGGNADAGSIAYMVFAQFIYGIAIGVAIAYAALFILKRVDFGTGFSAVFIIGIALLSFALPALVGGNGYLSVYIVGIIIGNAKIREKQALVHFFDGLTGLMQMLIFFLLGLLATPSLMLPTLVPALLIALFVTIIARPIAVFAIMSPTKCKLPQQLLVSFAGLRGAASVVFAIMATVNDAYLKNDVFHIVFCIVLFSILFQGTFIPAVAKKLDMIDADEDVFKTFNDYVYESGLHFLKLEIRETHPWKNTAIKDLSLPPDTLLAAILRDKTTLAPNGDTVILEGDIAVLTGHAFSDVPGISLKEHTIPGDSKWKDKPISEFAVLTKALVIMIKRDSNIVIPSGDTIIKENDIIVVDSPI